MAMSPTVEAFVVHWGEMGSRWGVNRSVAQIHALLYLATEPLHAEGIAETLGIARSNVSNSLKELQSFGLVRLSHVLGDRRDHFEALQDPWDMLMTVVEARKRREIDPTVAMLRDCVAKAEADPRTDPKVKQRIADMLGFLETLTGWYDQVRRIPRPALTKIIRLGERIARYVG